MENERKICQCCGMPLDESMMTKNKDGSINEEYCRWCYVDGKYTYTDMDELINQCVPFMVNQGFTEKEAREYMKGLLPSLKYWKKQ